MIRAVLFDLDGTLLDIDLDGFLRAYFLALGPVVGGLSRTVAPREAIAAVLSSTDAMCRPHPGETNRAVFNATFAAATGVDLGDACAVKVIDAFYRDQFPALQGSHGPRRGGLGAVRAALDSGLLTALATNPIFPRAAVDERMRWAALEQEWFDLVTSYENMHACKPHKAYFLEVAAALDVPPTDCLMVGDDPTLDMSAAEAGMKTFYVAQGDGAGSDWRGSLDDVAALLAALDR